jgi:DNA-binding CsgD family transcriptional regulator
MFNRNYFKLQCICLLLFTSFFANAQPISSNPNKLLAAMELLLDQHGESTDILLDSLQYYTTIAEKNNYYKVIGKGHELMGGLKSILGNANAALVHHNKSIAAYEKINFYEGLASEWFSAAVLHQKANNNFAAIAAAQNALNNLDKSENYSERAATYLLIAGAYGNQAKYDSASTVDALQYFTKTESAINAGKQNNTITIPENYRLYAQLYSTKGKFYIEKKEYSNAINYLQTAVAFAAKTKNPGFFSFAPYMNLANAFAESTQPDSAIFYGNLALKNSKGLSSKNVSMARIFYSFGKAYMAKANLVLAKLYYDSAIYYGSKDKNLSYVKSAHFGLYQLYQQQGNTNQALKALQAYVAINDSLYNTENLANVTNIKTKYETEKKELENQELKTTATFRRNIIIALTLFAIALLLSLLFFIRNRKLERTLAEATKSKLQQQQLLQQEKALTLEKQNESLLLNKLLDEEENKRLKETTDLQDRQLTTANLTLEQQNKQLQDVYKTLYTIGQNATTNEDKVLVKAIRQQIKSSINITDSWDNVTLHFEKVHPNFFNKLTSHNVSLTQNDIKLCAYTKLNLSTKDIAQLMAIDTQSVRMNRYRLKKKLQLTEEQDLISYLINL